jgi:hypothetical protein
MNRARCRGCIASMSGLCPRDPRQNEVSNNRCAQLDCADAEMACRVEDAIAAQIYLAYRYLAYRMSGTADNQL